MQIVKRVFKMLYIRFYCIVIVGLLMTAWTGLCIALDIDIQDLSLGQSVPIGELEAVGTIPGCTATLIADNLVLTAAHCVCPSETDAQNCQTRTTFTLHDVFPIDNPSTPIDESKSRVDVNIAGNVRVHPEYTLRGWLREDYAVIELDQPITAVAKVTPIPIEAPHNIPFSGDTLTLVGYGLTGTNCQGPGLGKMKMDVPIAVSGWGGISFKNETLHSCPGDSGGPALNSNKFVVGVASWVSGGDSTYRPTSYAYNWIHGIPQLKWSSCSWIPIEQGGKNSHQPTQLCPNGSFLTALDLDGDRSISGHDAPVIGQARCCKVAGAENLTWDSSSWVGVEQAGINSHSMGGAWCPQGQLITGIDLDTCGNCDAKDSPVIGQVQCSKLAGSQYNNWGSSYWMDVGPQKSHQAGAGWCLDGAFITQMDLDRVDAADPHDSPVIGQVKCSAMMPGTPTGCMATLYGNLLLHIPILSYFNPIMGNLKLWADFVYDFNPSYPTLIPFKLTNTAVINDPSFSCSASTLSDNFKIHIPNVIFPDGVTHLWVDMEYSPVLSTNVNFYWVVSDYGVVSN